jgi:uncharacterized repeat protein (TIGR02543 family)
VADAATYYLDAVNGNDSNSGSASAPWRTIDRAKPYGSVSPQVVASDTVILKSGNYGKWRWVNWTNPGTDYTTYQPDITASVVFTEICFVNTEHRNTHVRIDGIQAVCPSFNYLDDGRSVVYLQMVNYFEIKNCYIGGRSAEDWYGKGLRVLYGSHILVDNCTFVNTTQCITGGGDGTDPLNDMTIQNCRIGGAGCWDDAMAFSNLSNCNFINNDISCSAGMYDFVCWDDNHTRSGAFNVGDAVTQEVTGATGRVAGPVPAAFYNGNDTGNQEGKGNALYILSVTGLEFLSGQKITDTVTNATLTPSAVGIGPHADLLQIWSDSGHTSGNIVIARNKFHDNPNGQGLFLKQMNNVLIENNLFYGQMLVHTCQIADKSIGGTIRNNTFCMTYTGNQMNDVELYSNSGTGQTFSIYNNIICGSLAIDNDFGQTLNLKNNIIGRNVFQNQVPSPDSTNYVYGHNMTDIEKAVLFINPNSEDYQIRAGALAIDFGDPNYASSTDMLGNSRSEKPDAGCYEYASSQTYTLNTTAVNGTVAKSPDKASYNSGESVILQATPNTGCHFVNWSGDTSGTDSSVTITMNSNKSVTANFAINTYTLSMTATNGSVTKNPDKTSYNYGEQVTIQATPNTGYHFVSWSGDASGTNSSVTITMNSNKSVTANFAINTYTLSITAINGSVTKNPNKTSYNYGEQVTIQAVPNTGYAFTSWAGDASESNNPVTLTMNANKSATANFVYMLVDNIAPSVTNFSPATNSVQVPINSLITLHIVDTGKGVDSNSVTITVNSNVVYTGNTTDYNSVYGHCRRTGTKTDYTFIYQLGEVFNFDRTVDVTVNAADLAGNVMDEYSYSFNTETWSFGKNKKVDSDSDNLDKGTPVMATDSSGNIWVAWDAGPAGSRDIYVGNLTAEDEDFSTSIKLTNNAADQYNPAAAVGYDDKLYVAWQDNRNEKWDIYISTSIDGVNWSAEMKVTDSDSNHINPAIVVDSTSPNRAYIVWQDDLAGNQDIYIASSNNAFVTKTVSRITSVNSDQTEPAIAVDSNNTVYVVWTDSRNGASDIYGAASNNGPWTNVPIVNKPGNQSSPAIATETSGTVLNLVWVDDIIGNKNIYYAASQGLPASPLVGRNIVDDSSGADQMEPTIIATGSKGNGLRIFACWQDKRNITGSSKDTDLYFVEINSDAETNVFAGDDSANSNQSQPVIGIDEYGYPCLAWVDDRNTNADIYYAGSTVVNPNLVASKDVSISSGATVGTEIEDIKTVDDVSVVMPPGSYLCDVNITIAKVKNPPELSVEYLSLPYEFGPSGIDFIKPVTITIPYETSESNYLTSVYWYNILTSSPSQQGISNVEIIEISPTLYAVSFKTTHFTQFFIGGSSPGGGSGGGGGGGGGCSMSPNGQGSIVEFLLPYIGLTVVMTILKLRDKQKKNVHNITGSG